MHHPPYSTCYFLFFFFNAPATTEIYTLSLHDALPISGMDGLEVCRRVRERKKMVYVIMLTSLGAKESIVEGLRSEEHTSELQSRFDLVCRLLLEKKKHNNSTNNNVHDKKCSPSL